jgi:hypothetical protein
LQCIPEPAPANHHGAALRNISGKRTGYAVRSPARKSPSHGIGLQPAASEADKLHAAITSEVETLRLRVRALTSANTNLRRRLKNLESANALKPAQ